ncbi:MAG: PAS domain S-box protein [Candidatus Rokuibacteriota bacterium]
MDGVRPVLAAAITYQGELRRRQRDDIGGPARTARNITIPVISGAIVATTVVAVFALGAVVARWQARARRARESVMTDAARRIAAVVDNSDDAIIGQDLDGIITSWNAAAERMFGYAAAEAVGRPLALIVPSQRGAEADGVLGRLRHGQGIDHLETIRRTKDGRLVDVALTISPLTDDDGTLLGASGIVRDMTESKQTREALRRSEATALAFIESAAEGILIVDDGGHIVVANIVIEKMFGYAQGELLGQRMELLLPERLRERHVGHRAAYAAEPRVRSMGRGLDLAGRRRDGTEFPVEISLSYVRTPHGVQVMAFVTDITERLVRERTARQSEKLAALGALSASLAHELNNPLTIIGSRIELMLLEGEDEPLSPTVREDLAVIHRQVQRVGRLAQGLLSYARPADSQRLPVDLNSIVAEIVLLAEKQLVKDGVRISVSLDPTLPRVLGHAGALEQVLLNIVTNAQQAIEGPGEVRIATRLAAGRVRGVQLVVADTGRGIPADVLAKIFDPFFTTRSSGTGLGLSITNRIVQDHDGTIDIRSAPGEGTEFTLSFPAAADAQAAA